MIRQLCFAAIAVLFAASSCSANILIDNFTSASPVATSITNFDYVQNQGYEAEAGALVFPDNGTASLGYTFSAGDLAGQTALVFDYAVTGGPIDLTVTTSDGVTSIINLPVVSLAAGATPTTINIGAGLGSATSLTLDFANNSGSDAVFTFGSSSGSFTAVPEPTSLLMFPAAIGLVLARRRRKN
jgi:hypothetical protein